VELALPTQSVSGTDIRKDVSNKVIESSEFRAGMIYALHHLWPVLLPCVDIAIFNQDYTQVLLGRKPGEKEFRFVGGHAEKKHGSYEIGARYEVLEEATVEPGAMQYIGSAVIDDWRYRTVDRGIMTAFFATTVSNQASHPNDDIVETRWFDVDKLKQSDFVDTHHILYKMMMAWLVKRSVKENYGTAKA
jgi:bifunctional NMN adenylyltransferase/nudix hydrolase